MFHETAEDIGLKIVGKQESIDYKQSDFRTLMARIKNEYKPDAIYFGGTSQTGAGQIAKDMVAEGLGGTRSLFPMDASRPHSFRPLAPNIFKTLKCYVTFGGLPPDKLQGKGKEFVDRYKAKFHTMPEGYAVYGYEAGLVALEAIKKAGKKNREAITDACLGNPQLRQGSAGQVVVRRQWRHDHDHAFGLEGGEWRLRVREAV